MEANGFKYVSSATIAKKLGIDDTQVRKDIASIGYMGKPKVGFNTSDFKLHIEEFLNMKENKEAILIGAGNLGTALVKYDGFKIYGLNIVAIFDKDNSKIGNKISNVEVLHMSKLDSYIKKRNIKMAILAITAETAPELSESLMKSGIKAIWNFTPIYLDAPQDVFIWNENLAASFVAISQFVAKSKTS